jgi:prolyl oligopeptidase
MNAPRPRTAALVLTSLASACATVRVTSHAPDVPLAAKRPVVDTYHGVAVTDDYRWLENWDDPEVRKWSEDENAAARRALDALPSVEAIRARVTELMKAPSVQYFGLRERGGTWFATKRDSEKQQPVIVARSALDDPTSERVLFDPNAIDPTGGTSIDFHVASLDGKLLAVSLSEHGTESGTVHCYDTATGREVGEAVPRVNGGTAGGSVAWNADATGFWYTRYPHEGERPAEDLDFWQQVWFHALGTPVSDDRYEIGREFPRIAEIELSTTDDGRCVLATVANGDGGEYAHWLRTADGAWTQVTRFEDGVKDATFGRDDALWLHSRKDAARGKILRIPLATPKLDAAKTVVPEGDGAVESYLPTRSRLFVVLQTGGPNALRTYDLAGAPLPSVPLDPVSSVAGLARTEGDDVVLCTESYVSPPAWRRYVAKDDAWKSLDLGRNPPIDFSDVVASREVALSKDGTRVPMTIVRRRDAHADGSNSALLNAYGGYSVSISPRFQRMLRVWLDQGGVFAVANIRGGGECGETWHQQGCLTRKQNVFDDFAACANRLVELGWTKPERLAVEGGSNGGLLMGAFLTQNPGLARAVVSHVGIYDMLRVETTPNGAFNVTEFGTVADPEQFKALYAYSPYHHVTDGTKYPAVLFLTGANDPRVDPYHSRKMTARLQAATASGRPVLLRTSSSTGHGGGTPLDARIEQDVDVHAFLFHELGVAFRAARSNVQ